MASLNQNRRLSLAATIPMITDPESNAQIKSILLMTKIVEADVSFHSFAEAEGDKNLALLGVDLEGKDHMRVFSFLDIVRFLHSSERWDFNLASVEPTMALMLKSYDSSDERNFLKFLVKAIEKKEYLFFDDGAEITKLSGPTIADLVGYFLVLDLYIMNLPVPVQDWKDRIENHYWTKMQEVNQIFQNQIRNHKNVGEVENSV